MKFLCLTASLLISLTMNAFAIEARRPLPLPVLDPPASGQSLQKIVLSGGCFWGVQAVFEHMSGVKKALSGYAGGDKDTATYALVSTGSTGHAESVEVTYDPKRVSLGQILQVFFSVAHDPTQRDMQGPDEGPQYRSAVFVDTKEQQEIVTQYIDQLDAAKLFSSPITTKVEIGKIFYPAESYHQDYLVHNPTKPYIIFNDLPKLDNLRRLYPKYYVATPTLTTDQSK